MNSAFNELISEVDSDELEEEWSSLIDSIRQDRISRVLEESRDSQHAGAYRAAIVMLWAATIEELLELLLMYSASQLKETRHLPNKLINSKKDLEDVHEDDLIKAAENVGLLDNKEALLLERIRQLRHACAHGEDIDLDGRYVTFVLSVVRDAVFNKQSRAGINVEAILNSIDKGNPPKDHLEAVSDFRKDEQLHLIRELYKERTSLPLKRMNRRDKYLIRKNRYSRDEKKKRDQIDEIISYIWGDLDKTVRRQIKDQALKNRHSDEAVLGFLLNHSSDVMTPREFNEVLKDFLSERESSDWEDQNDVAINLAAVSDFKIIDSELVKEIWLFAKCDTPNETEKTREYYAKILKNLGSEHQEYIIADLSSNIAHAHEEFKNRDLDEVNQALALRSINWKYLKRYYDAFEEEFRSQIRKDLEESILWDIQEVETFFE